MQLRLILLLALLAPMLAFGQQPLWMRTIPDQERSQEVDLASLVAAEHEWVAWTRSYYFPDHEKPVGVFLPDGATQHLKLAVKCLPDSTEARVLEVTFKDLSGQTIHSSTTGLDERYRPMAGLEYGANAPGLICVVALAHKHRKPFVWPMRKSEHRAFIQSHR
jgi:hypothetical protein